MIFQKFIIADSFQEMILDTNKALSSLTAINILVNYQQKSDILVGNLSHPPKYFYTLPFGVKMASLLAAITCI